ncbi:phosphate/phosphite/phosphonate ABC transporter substrate-binding protein [Microbacterium sp.]|uniref:phosphate/phosphite/phosphonate ABC transporter substrate-binding protein n=1 Tax=Microbacterium sp. TaxID=51671 RepID=UPI003C76C191
MTSTTMRIASALGFLALGASALTACSPTAADAEDTVAFAVTDLQGLEELQREYGAFEAKFEELTGLDLEFFPVSDRTAAAAALGTGDVDVVFTGPAEYVVIHEKTDAEPLVSIERDGYRSCIYVKTESGVTDVSDLAGGSIAMSDIGSTSGHLGPSQLLVDAGLEPGTDIDVVMAGNGVHQALLRDDVTAVGIGCHDYEEFMAEEDDPSAYTVIQEGDLLPPDVIMARADLDPEIREAVRSAFTEHFDELLASMLEGKDNAKYADARLIETTDADYDAARDLYRAIGVDDFSEFVGE